MDRRVDEHLARRAFNGLKAMYEQTLNETMKASLLSDMLQLRELWPQYILLADIPSAGNSDMTPAAGPSAPSSTRT